MITREEFLNLLPKRMFLSVESSSLIFFRILFLPAFAGFCVQAVFKILVLVGFPTIARIPIYVTFIDSLSILLRSVDSLHVEDRRDPLSFNRMGESIMPLRKTLKPVVPDEPMYELRLLVRHRWRLIQVHGNILRYAISLLACI